MDPDNYVTSDELRSLLELLDMLNQAHFGDLHISYIALGDTNGESLGEVRYNDSTFVYHPGASR